MYIYEHDLKSQSIGQLHHESSENKNVFTDHFAVKYSSKFEDRKYEKDIFFRNRTFQFWSFLTAHFTKD